MRYLLRAGLSLFGFTLSSSAARDGFSDIGTVLKYRADAKSSYPRIGIPAGGAWSYDILQIWHEVEARVEPDVIVPFQNYFAVLNARRVVAQWQAEFSLQLLDLRQNWTDPPVRNFKASLILRAPPERADVHKAEECKMLEHGNLR